MNFLEMSSAVDEAETNLRYTDALVEKMIRLVKGRLRSQKSFAQAEQLKELKRELQNFNAHTREWK